MTIQYGEIEQAVLEVDRMGFNALTAQLVKEDPLGFEAVFLAVMDRIGKRWEEGELALSQVYMSGILFEEAMRENKRPDRAEKKDLGLGLAVFEDFHALGKRMVANYLELNAYEFVDLGIGKTVEELVALVEAHRIRILLVSTLMMPAALHVRALRDKLDPGVKILVGGAPFRIDPDLWKQVGADGFASKASDVCQLIEEVAENDN